jgi:pSer/pThr/pTyr-binding forkhead associated (FHA) protein
MARRGRDNGVIQDDCRQKEAGSQRNVVFSRDTAITIEFVNADIREQEITLTGLPVMIGRSPEADVPLDGDCVSRQHCEIDHMNGKPLVRDLGSKNGTFINGEVVRQAIVGPDDRITIGRINLHARC